MQSQTIATRSFPRMGFIFLCIAIGGYILMRVLSKGISSDMIIDFELAKTVERATDLMTALGHQGKENLLASIHGDFIFIIGYTGILYYTAQWMGVLSGSVIFRKAGYFFSWLALIAGVCDLLENAGMIYTLLEQPLSWVVHFTYDMAVAKFSLIFIVLLFILICLFFWAIDKLAGDRQLRLKK